MKKIYLLFLLLVGQSFYAQTEIDGIMMGKNQFCTGVIFENSSWKNYWEGTFYRENLNMGTVTTQKYSVNGNFGISDKLNVILSIPYVITKATSGTMNGQKGIQDLSLFVKYLPYEKTFENSSLSFYLIGGYSLPMSNYVADYMPLSIGFHSKRGTLRIMGDYQIGSLFVTTSGSYEKRSNIKIDRNVYYTTEMHYTNEVDLPDAMNVNIRFGYRTSSLIAEGILDNWITQKGSFDITSNNMPFPSNTMNATKIGFNLKYYFPKMPNLSAIAGYNSVINGRNVGQSSSVYGGLFYILDFNKSETTNSSNNEK